MKKGLTQALKIGVPLLIGVWLIFFFYDQLGQEQRLQLFSAFRAADLRWIALATVVGWTAHVSRAWRWRYILEPLGHAPGFWSCYHAVMAGYFMNLFIPRAGEASRAISLYRTEKVPFEQGFGTILAERAVDMIMLLGITGITILLQLEKLDLFKARIAAFRAGQGADGSSNPAFWPWAIAAIAVVLVAAVVIVLADPKRRAQAMDLVRGFVQGLRAVLRTRNKVGFAVHTIAIWAAYIGMFWLGFWAMPNMSGVPLAGILAGFVAGAIGIVLVQGGVGVYPAFVALIISVYLPPMDEGLIRPDALALGWLLWTAQTLMLIVLGGLSLILLALKRVNSAP